MRPTAGFRRYYEEKRRAILLCLARNYTPDVITVAKAVEMARPECWSLLWRMHEEGDVILIRGEWGRAMIPSAVRLPRLMRTG